MLSQADRDRIEELRLERLREQLPTLKSMRLYISPDNTLELSSQEASHMDELLTIEEEIKAQTWLILGCRRITICFFGEEIFADSTLPSPETLESLIEAFPEEPNMVATATAERTHARAEGDTVRVADPTNIIDQQAEAAIVPVIQALVADRMRLFLAGEAFFNLVKLEVAKQVEEAIAPLRQPISATSNGGGNGADAIVDVTAVATSDSKPEPTLDLKLPRGIKNNLTKSTRDNLNKALPLDLGDRRRYLEEISSGSEGSKKWLGELCKEVERAIGVATRQSYEITYFNMAKKMLVEFEAISNTNP